MLFVKSSDLLMEEEHCDKRRGERRGNTVRGGMHGIFNRPQHNTTQHTKLFGGSQAGERLNVGAY